MKKIYYKTILFIILTITILSQSVIYASMADFTDEQADKKLEQEQTQWKQEQEERINKSSNNYLKSLKINDYEIVPNFDKQTINYKIEKEIDSENIIVEAEADDEKASVDGTGKILLNSGENNITINVTAENGMVRTYYVKVIKKLNKNVSLKALKIYTEENSNLEIEPEFNEETFEYNCTVKNYINNVNIDATSNVDNAKIEISGNDNLKEGLNQILIKVSLDDENKVVYKINVNKEKATNDTELKENEIKYEIFIPIIIAIVCVLIMIIYKKIKKTR